MVDIEEASLVSTYTTDFTIASSDATVLGFSLSGASIAATFDPQQESPVYLPIVLLTLKELPNGMTCSRYYRFSVHTKITSAYMLTCLGIQVCMSKMVIAGGPDEDPMQLDPLCLPPEFLPSANPVPPPLLQCDEIMAALAANELALEEA